jgi:hypothetical protein
MRALVLLIYFGLGCKRSRVQIPAARPKPFKDLQTGSTPTMGANPMPDRLSIILFHWCSQRRLKSTLLNSCATYILRSWPWPAMSRSPTTTEKDQQHGHKSQETTAHPSRPGFERKKCWTTPALQLMRWLWPCAFARTGLPKSSTARARSAPIQHCYWRGFLPGRTSASILLAKASSALSRSCLACRFIHLH